MTHAGARRWQERREIGVSPQGERTLTGIGALLTSRGLRVVVWWGEPIRYILPLRGAEGLPFRPVFRASSRGFRVPRRSDSYPTGAATQCPRSASRGYTAT